MNFFPKISVITPCFNSAKTLSRAINSVIQQNYSNYEHIIVDGGSQDDTLEILKSYIHLIWISEKDSGQSDAMNKGFQLSTGDIIVYLNADDVFLPGIFEIVIKAFSSNINIDIVVGDGILDCHGKEILYRSETSYYKCLSHFRYTFPWNPVSYFYKRCVQEYYGEFPTDNHFSMDFHFIIATFRKFTKKKINQPFGIFYFGSDNKTSVSDAKANCRKAVRSFTLENKYFFDFLFYYLHWYYFETKSFLYNLYHKRK